jgi:hypothetical protein
LDSLTAWPALRVGYLALLGLVVTASCWKPSSTDSTGSCPSSSGRCGLDAAFGVSGLDAAAALNYDECESAAFLQKGGKLETSQHQTLARQTDGDFVEFFRAGKRMKGVFQCVSCQQLLVTHDVLRPCANCGEKIWERGDWSPFRRV